MDLPDPRSRPQCAHPLDAHDGHPGGSRDITAQKEMSMTCWQRRLRVNLHRDLKFFTEFLSIYKPVGAGRVKIPKRRCLRCSLWISLFYLVSSFNSVMEVPGPEAHWSLPATRQSIYEVFFPNSGFLSLFQSSDFWKQYFKVSAVTIRTHDTHVDITKMNEGFLESMWQFSRMLVENFSKCPLLSMDLLGHFLPPSEGNILLPAIVPEGLIHSLFQSFILQGVINLSHEPGVG